jgi:hypothetical protein
MKASWLVLAVVLLSVPVGAANSEASLKACGELALVPPPDTAAWITRDFGMSTAIAGNVAVVGARVTSSTGAIANLQKGGPITFPGPPGPILSGSSSTFGVVYVYKNLPGLGWSLVQTLQATDADPVNDFAGALAFDAGLLVVSNPKDDDFGPESGSAYVYRDLGAAHFQLLAKLHALDAHPNARFGAAVAVDQERILVGSTGARHPLTLAPQIGAAYVFHPILVGAWQQVARYHDPAGQFGDELGFAVALSDDAALVGAPGQDAFGSNAGRVHVLEQLAPGLWQPTAFLTASDAAPGDRYGSSVALQAGYWGVVGAPGKNNSCAGCGAAYQVAGDGIGAWFETVPLAALADLGLTPGSALGSAVAVSGDTIAVGAPGKLVVGAISGAVFTFGESLSGLVLTSERNRCTPASGDQYGQSLDAQSGLLLVGAPGADDLIAPDRGAAGVSAFEAIELVNETVALFFSEPEAAALVTPGPPTSDPACAEAALFPQIAVEDRIDGNPLFSGHRYVLRGRVFEIDLVPYPLPSTFDYDGYDPSAEDEVYRGSAADCNSAEFDLQYDVLDPQGSGDVGTLATFLWTGCEARNDLDETLGAYEVELQVFLPQGEGHARFNLSAAAEGTPVDWAFWCGKLNLSIVEDHEGAAPGDTFHLLTPFGHLVTDPALNLTAHPGIPARADTFGRPSNQTLGFYDSQGRGLYAALGDTGGDRAKSFQFYGCPGDGSANPTVSIISLSYQEEVEPGATFAAVPSFIGRFRGDWYDLAELYRDFLEGTPILNKGPLYQRTDVPDFAKRCQMAGVFSIGNDKYWEEPPPKILGPGLSLSAPTSTGMTTTLPDRVQEYMDHYGIDRMITLQFGAPWVAGGDAGTGVYGPNRLLLANAALMEEKQAELALDGRDLRYMLYFLDTVFTTASSVLDWDALGVRTPAGNLIEYPLTGSVGVYMDPSTTEWQDHLYAVCFGLGKLGVDGIYCDNAFPDLREYDFSADHGHAPGFGSYLTAGFGEMFEAIQEGGATGNGGTDADFMTYTEFFFEGFIARSDTYGPEQAWTDWMTADENTRSVPLVSVLYHDAIVMGPPLITYYTDDTYHDKPNNVWNNVKLPLGFAKAERSKGRRGANYTMAYAWANGCPIWCPDPAFANPLDRKFVYELAEIPGFEALLEEALAVCQFGADLAVARGFALAEPFLTAGQRLRDLGDFSAPAASVVLAQIYNPYNPSTLLGPETEEFPAIVHGVWKDLETGYVGIALANYTDGSATASFTFDAATYGLATDVSYQAQAVTASGLASLPDPYDDAFLGSKAFELSLGAEEVLFVRIAPL